MRFTSEEKKLISRHPWLFLSLAYQLSPAKWLALLSRTALSAAELVNAYLEECLPGIPHQALVKAALDEVSVSEFTASLIWLDTSAQHAILPIDGAAYPPLLKHLNDPPLVLYIRGNLSCLQVPAIAVVGSRRASHYGLDCARVFSEQLVIAGMAVISGLAVGIDGAAHHGALKAGGSTLGVLGCGIDQTYPKRHASLYESMLQNNGAILSEFAPGTPVRAKQFPRRNRLIAALSEGTLVIEARIKSGTLITANMALNMGKEIFVVPGSIHNPLTQGCHHLIQQGAKLVTCVEDILDEFSFLNYTDTKVPALVPEKSHGICLATDKLLDSVDYDITDINIIAERNNLPVPAVMATLLEYELRGLVAAVPGGYIKLRGK